MFCTPNTSENTHLAKVLLHKLAANHTNEGCSGVVRHSLGEHGLAGARSTIQQHAAGGVDTDLSVQVAVRQWQLYSLANLLLLDVKAANVLRGE